MTTTTDTRAAITTQIGMAMAKEDEQANAVYELHAKYAAAKKLFEQYRDERRGLEAKLASKKRRGKKDAEPAAAKPATETSEPVADASGTYQGADRIGDSAWGSRR